ncbi:aldo/keto reductase [Holotrichia oblita]|nr:aldo/keto reductase [Holotrichia oblita]
MSKVPSITFNNGLHIPIFGLGTWKSQLGQVTQAVKDAIDIGYRHIDCAYIYGNEKEVGEALDTKFQQGVVKREDIFITSKLWNTFHKPELEHGELFPKDEQGNIQFSDVDYIDTWKVMEKLVAKGLVKSIGLSNFNKRQIERVLKIATVKPANLQIECHPYLNQKRLINYCKSVGISVTAYSPLGSPDRPWAKPGEPLLMEDQKLKDLAVKYKKTPAQVLLRYQVQRGIVTIPKSVTKSRIQENFSIFDFELKPEDIDYIDTFDCNGRFCPMTASLGHPHHPFENDEF